MLDTIHTWDNPVTIVLDGKELTITAPVHASHVLFVDWPAPRTDKHKIACQTCNAAMEGADPQVAWLAFIEATIEADIFVR